MYTNKITAIAISVLLLVVIAGCSGAADPEKSFKEARAFFDQGK